MATFSLMKLCVEPLLNNTMTSYCPILADTRMVLKMVYLVKACKEISSLGGNTISIASIPSPSSPSSKKFSSKNKSCSPRHLCPIKNFSS